MENTKNLDDIFEQVRSCRKCKLHKYRDQCVFAEGKSDSMIMLIGLSPGKEENATGQLFIGPAGEYLNELLQVARIKRDSLYITNIIKCHAPTHVITKTEVDACSPYLDEQIEVIQPRTIIALGSIVTRFVLEKHHFPVKKISENHGKAFRVSSNDFFDTGRDMKIITMFHPSAGLRHSELLDVIRKDWRELDVN
ncbi:MAG: uracil-DNA glycosylase [Candidatus Aureabacteria bacterium]|nr:uracil-DNA glycosylase [Candidatus Auribacterota bacterium]